MAELIMSEKLDVSQPATGCIQVPRIPKKKGLCTTITHPIAHSCNGHLRHGKNESLWGNPGNGLVFDPATDAYVPVLRGAGHSRLD